jgi:hypothetical protein
MKRTAARHRAEPPAPERGQLTLAKHHVAVIQPVGLDLQEQRGQPRKSAAQRRSSMQLQCAEAGQQKRAKMNLAVFFVRQPC